MLILCHFIKFEIKFKKFSCTKAIKNIVIVQTKYEFCYSCIQKIRFLDDTHKFVVTDELGNASVESRSQQVDVAIQLFYDYILDLNF